MRQSRLLEHTKKGATPNTGSPATLQGKSATPTAKITSFLLDGATLAQVSRTLYIKKYKLTRIAEKLVKMRVLERHGISPILFTRGKNYDAWNTGSKGVAVFSPSARTARGKSATLFVPHRFGATFWLMRRPEKWVGVSSTTPMRNWVQYIWKQPDYTILASPNKVVIWCHLFSKGNVEEIIKKGILGLKNRAVEFQQEQGVQLMYDKMLNPIEWTIENKSLSNYVQKVLDLKSEPKVIAGANFVVDRSHPKRVEVNGEEATNAVKSLEWLLTDCKPTIEVVASAIKGNTEQIGSLAEQVGDLTVVIKEGFRKVR